MGMSFSHVFRLLCMILLLSQVAWSLTPCEEERGRVADCPRPRSQNRKRGPPSGRP
ncbi:hypothetical protein MKX01_021648 [Papaver californicum]|nr:hypothetical protein MKX01_021648 [Papaver californicum]